MPNRRLSIPRNVRRELFIEAGYKCSVPNCNHEAGLDLHHIDSDTANCTPQNLILLCAIHHRMATAGQIDRKACRLIRALLELSRGTASHGPIHLHTRREYVECPLSELRKTTSYRAIMVGPFFLHPDWYVQKRNKSVQIPNYDSELLKFMPQEARFAPVAK